MEASNAPAVRRFRIGDAAHQPEHDHADGPQVCRLVTGLLVDHVLRRQIPRRAAADGARTTPEAQPEVDQDAGAARVGAEGVGRLNVAVDDTPIVGKADCRCQVTQNLLRVQLSPTESLALVRQPQVCQRIAIDVFGDETMEAGIGAQQGQNVLLERGSESLHCVPDESESE